MKKYFGVFAVVLLFLSLANAEQVKQKFGIGLGAGFMRTQPYDIFTTTGTAFNGNLRFGLTEDLELGIGYTYEYYSLADNIMQYFVPMRRSGSTLDQSDYPWYKRDRFFNPVTNKDEDQQPWRTVNGTTGEIREKKYESLGDVIGLTAKSDSLPIEFTSQPIDLFIKFRSLSKSIFNPYLVAGFGMVMWSAADENTGDDIEVFQYDDYLADTSNAINGSPTSSGEWKKFKATQFAALFGFGFEIFPISNVGVDVGVRARYLFGNDFVDQVTDTLRGDIQALASLNFYYGGVKDSDKDGVIDENDKCPDTPFGATVDEFGCPIDSDQDGVPDGLDMCPNTPIGAAVDATGCPSDEDGDGVYDGIDKCPGTPFGAKVEPATGCPTDGDGDGVPDHTDECPNTPAGAIVNKVGCPNDSDMDGVYDGIDKCPNTPMGAAVNEFGCERTKADTDGDGVPDDRDRCPATPIGATIDEFGCPKDTDADGIYDYKDACPGTPKGAMVDQNGCPLDGDGDGVFDGKDKCPNTPLGAIVDSLGCHNDSDADGVPDGLDQCPRTRPGAEVDAKGCPKDTDGDGVPNGIDKCPNTPTGVEVDTTGCPKGPKLKKGESITVRINYATCSWDITSSESIKLQDAVNMLRSYPDMIIEVEGHTDNVGIGPACTQKGVKDNVDLSLKRAEGVRAWLIDKGIDGARVRTKGYGDTKPIAPNTTNAGKDQNRRIELRCVENCPGE